MGESSEAGSEGSSSGSPMGKPSSKPGGQKPQTGANPTDMNPEAPMPSEGQNPAEDNGGGQGGGGNPPKSEGSGEGTPSEDPMTEQSKSNPPSTKPAAGNQKPGGQKPGQQGQQSQGQQGQSQSGGGPPGQAGSGAPPTSGEGGNQSGGEGTASGRAPQGKYEKPEAESTPLEQTPEQIDLENREKALSLQIKQLQEELSRGEVPDDLKDTGYSAEELDAFLRRLDQQIHNADSSTPEAQARQRQFEELLKGVDPGTQGELKIGATGDREASQSTGPNRRPTPKRFESAEKAFRKKMQKAQ